MESLVGRVVLVTGGSRGIGEAVARTLVAARASVALTGRDPSAVEAAARRVATSTEQPGRSLGLAADVRSLASMQAAVAATVARFGRIDGVVDHGVRVATVMPGSVATAFSGRAPDEADAWKLGADDVAEAVAFLLRSPARSLPPRIELRPAQRRPGGAR